MKQRLDIILVEKGFAPSREKAKAMIMSGIVFVNGQREDKAGTTFDEEAAQTIEIHGSTLRYVSRGGLKLEKAVEQFIGVFMDLQKKSVNSEISTKSLDLRGLLSAMKIVRAGLSPLAAVQMGVVNKTFDIFEKEIVDDVVRTRIPEEWTKDDVYA